jgi:polysaccharide export outer membrane protein
MFSFFGTTKVTTNNDPNFAQQSNGFLVDAQGYIQFPIIGSVNVKDKTSIEIRNLMLDALSQYLEKPVITVRYLNFKIMLMGDVLKPGVYTFPSERVTLFEAISSAGDLTIFGERKKIQLIREVEGKNQIIRLDLTDKNIISTKYMYLQPNDIIYIEPGKGKIASSDNVYRILPMVVTGLNIIALLIYRFR